MNNQTHLEKVFDQLMLEVEASGFEATTMLLAGIIDGALAAGMAIDILRGIVFDHPVSSILKKSERTDIRLPKALAMLGFNQAISSREKLANNAIEQGWKRGKKICVIGSPGLKGLESLHQRDTSNISLFSDGFGQSVLKPDDNWQHVIAADIADDMDRRALGKFVTDAANTLAPGGTIQLASLMPQHIGSGWLRVCNARELHFHSVAELQKLARRTKLKFSHFFDASGSLVWAEFRSSID